MEPECIPNESQMHSTLRRNGSQMHPKRIPIGSPKGFQMDVIPVRSEAPNGNLSGDNVCIFTAKYCILVNYIVEKGSSKIITRWRKITQISYTGRINHTSQSHGGEKSQTSVLTSKYIHEVGFRLKP